MFTTTFCTRPQSTVPSVSPQTAVWSVTRLAGLTHNTDAEMNERIYSLDRNNTISHAGMPRHENCVRLPVS